MSQFREMVPAGVAALAGLAGLSGGELGQFDQGTGLWMPNGLTDQGVSGAWHRIPFGNVWVVDQMSYQIIDKTWFHRRDVAASGVTRLEFFNQGDADQHRSNWPSSTGLGTNEAAWITGFGIELNIGTDANGAAVANSLMGERAATTGMAADLEAYRQFGDNARVRGTIGSREFVDGLGIWDYPTGRGMVVTPGLASTTASIEHAITPFSNGPIGLPFRSRFEIPRPLPPQTKIQVQLTWNTAVTLPAACSITCHLYGIALRRASI